MKLIKTFVMGNECFILNMELLLLLQGQKQYSVRVYIEIKETHKNKKA